MGKSNRSYTQCINGHPWDGTEYSRKGSKVCRICIRNSHRKSRGLTPLPDDAPFALPHKDRTHCPQGHEYTDENTGRQSKGRFCKECKRYSKLKNKYGLTPEQYDALPQECQICGSVENLHVDHNHACCPGKKSCGQCIRGLLCGKCNRGIGMFLDDAYLLLKAAEFIKTGGMISG